MNTTLPSAQTNTRNRRGFLKGLGAVGTASVLCSQSALADSQQYARRFQLFVEGIFTDFSLIWPAPQLPPLPEGTVVSVRVEYPLSGRSILEWHTLVNIPGVSTQVVTLFHMRIDGIKLSTTPEPNFGLFGQILDNPVVDNPAHSPFGDLTGRVGMICGAFDAPGDNTTFTLFGGAAAGSHASAVRTATGSLHIQGDWDSF